MPVLHWKFARAIIFSPLEAPVCYVRRRVLFATAVGRSFRDRDAAAGVAELPMLVAGDALEADLLQRGDSAGIDERSCVLDYLLQLPAAAFEFGTRLVRRKHIFQHSRPPFTLRTLRRLQPLRQHGKYVFPHLAG